MIYKITEATDLDIMQLSNIGKAYWEEAYENNPIPLNITKFITYALLANGDPTKVIFVAKLEGEVVGFLWGHLEEEIWNDVIKAQDCMHYILPKHRGGLLAKRFVSHFESWAKEKGAEFIKFGCFSGVQGNKPAISLYSRLGYKEVGISLIKQL
jgi:GNAT superfamily N-acetyltransferase